MNRYLVEMQLAPAAFAAFVKNPGDRKQTNAAVVEAVGGNSLSIGLGSAATPSISSSKCRMAPGWKRW